MADFDIEVGFQGDPNDLANAVGNAVRKALSRAGDSAFRDITGQLRKIGTKSGADFGKNFERSSERATTAARRLYEQLQAIESQAAGVGASIGDSFDPRAIALVNVQLERVAEIQETINQNAGELGEVDLRELNSALSAARLELKSADIAFKESARAAIQSDKDKADSARQAARTQIVETQTAAKRESDIRRTSAQLQIAQTQSSTRRRVAIIEAATRTITALERGLRTIFQGTARVISSAFRSIGTVGAAAFSSLRRSVTNSNTDIRNSYDTTFSNANRTVRNSTQNQSIAVERFASSATSSLGEVGNAVGQLGSRMDGLNVKAVALAGILGAGVAKALSGGFRRATILENSERALTKLTGSAETARDLLTQVTDVVTGTPFALDQFADAATQLLAFNVEAEKIPRFLSAIGDAAAIRGGDSAQTIDTIVRSFGQITTTARVSLTEINSIAEAGVPALQILGNAFGKTTEEVRDLLSNGTIPAQEALDALTEGIINGTEGVNGATIAFGGLAKELGDTLQGSLANLGTAFDRAGANVIKAFTPAVVAGAKAATAAVDLIGSAVVSLANAVTNSPIFQLIANNIDRLVPVFKRAQVTLKPVFDFIAAGIVNLGTALGTLAALRRIPGLFTAIGFAVRRILTPFNLLIGAGILVGGFIQKLIDGSPELQASLRRLGDVVGQIAGVFRGFIDTGLGVISSVIDNVVTPAVNTFADVVASVLAPAIERLATFLENNVIPSLVRFAQFVQDTIIPVIRRGLTIAIDFARNAFQTLVSFIQEEVVPVVGPILERAVEIGTAAFQKSYDFLSGTVVPFFKDNLTPTLVGVGAALGALALTGGNLPLAGLIGGIAAAATVLRNADIRNALIENIQEGIEEVRRRLGDIFNASTLQKVGVGILKVANKIGRVLGDALSDRRLVATAGAIVAAGVAVAGSFLLGFADGILNNLDDLVALLAETLTKAFTLAVGEVIKDPKLILAIVGIIGSAAVLSRLTIQARRTGQVISQGLSSGLSAGTISGGGVRGLVSGLFGGPAKIQADAARVGQQISGSIARQIGSDARLITALGGQQPTNLQPGRRLGESFASALPRDIKNLQAYNSEVGKLKANLGQTAVEGTRLRVGLGEAFRGIVRRDITQVRNGITDIGTALRTTGREVATAAGAVAGGAYMASFAARALLEAEDVGGQITGALGLAAVGGGVFAATGSAPLAGAAVGIGVLAAALTAGAKEAKEFEARVNEYAEAIREANDAAEQTEALKNLFGERVQQQSTEVIDALASVGFSYDQFVRAVENGRVEELFGDLSVRADQLRGLIAADQAPTFIQKLADDGVGLSDIVRILGLLQSEQEAIIGGNERLAASQALAANQGRNLNYIAEGQAEFFKRSAAASDIAASATQAFKDKLQELNDARIEGLEEKVNIAKGALDEAKTAADEALTAVKNFFNGGASDDIANATDEATLGVAGLAESLTTDLTNAAGVGATELKAKLNESIRAVKDEATNVLAQGIKDGVVVDAASAAAALQPLLDVAGEKGGEGGAAATAAIQEVIAAFSLPEGTNLLEGAFDAQAEIEKAQGVVDSAETKLQLGLEIKPTEIPQFVTEALDAFREVGQGGVDGLAEGFSEDEKATNAAKAMAEASLAAAAEALGVESPSTKFSNLGAFSVEGYAQGIDGASSLASEAATSMANAAAAAVASGVVLSAWRRAGAEAGRGFVTGLNSQRSAVTNAARNIAQTAQRVVESELQISSPSKVFVRIGGQVVQGFIDGIDDDTPTFNTRLSRLADNAVRRLSRAGRDAARAIGTGFAEGGASFIGSVTGAIDTAYQEALSKAEQFRAVGDKIALGLFQTQGQGGGRATGGGTLAVELQRAFLNIQGVASRFTEGFQSVVDKAGDYAFTFQQQFEAGRTNRLNFLDRGLEVRQYAETLLQAGRGLKSVQFETRFWRDQLIKSARAAGATSADINELINTLGLSNKQLNAWAKSVAATTNAAKKAAAAEAERIKLEKKFQEQQEAAAKAADAREERERAAADAAAAAADAAPVNIPPPVFRDLVIQGVGGDPEAIALATANRVAFSVRR